ncbi:MAG TPA: cytochrome c oxidase subunit 3 [Methylocystis sp.]|nr:cytochrome c oxidase subunit 3 [Methylocystis sp.]
MSVLGLFFILVAGVATLYLWREGVMDRPWLEEGEVTAISRASGVVEPPPAAKVGLVVFLAVAGCLFSLLVMAFFMRMESPDWRTPPAPAIFWFNTAVLVASSAALQTAYFAANADEPERVRALLLGAGAGAAVFLLGQACAWREMEASGFYAASNAANAFFYLLTGTHALHLFGGLVALARTTGKAFAAVKAAAVATSVELCAIYWHFLLLVWLLMFAMLAGGADGLGVICRRLLS